MDWLGFVVEMTRALAWPSVVIGLTVAYRNQVGILLGALKKGRIGPAEFEFQQTVERLEAETELPPAPAPTGAAAEATSNPRGVILEAWLDLEDKLISLAMSRGLTRATARRYAAGPVRAVRQSGLLSNESLALLADLRGLRNIAAHDPGFSPTLDAVLTFVRLASELGQEVERLSEEGSAEGRAGQ